MNNQAGGVGGQQGGQDHRAGAERAQEELPFGADVPQAHAKRHRTRQTGQDDRGGFDDRVGEHAQAAKGSPRDVRIGAEGVAAAQRDHDPAEEQRKYDRPG
ncbi:MAG: hypothetical protein M5U05_13970 [Anaerolineales bacterium]|nr:hypothetical protein [Anaerolineales bacterium]